jgi:hypothetical protein
MKKLHFILLLAICTSLFSGCRQKEKNLDTLMDQLITIGYTGQFQRPSSGFEKAALSMFGVDDYLAFTSAEESFVVINFKSEDAVITEDRIETLMTLLENRITEEEAEKLPVNKDNWREHVFQNKNFVVAWEKQKPDDVINIIKRY